MTPENNENSLIANWRAGLKAKQQAETLRTAKLQEPYDKLAIKLAAENKFNSTDLEAIALLILRLCAAWSKANDGALCCDFDFIYDVVVKKAKVCNGRFFILAFRYAKDKNWIREIPDDENPDGNGSIEITAQGWDELKRLATPHATEAPGAVVQATVLAAGKESDFTLGVSMLDAALLFDDEPKVARQQVDRWQRSGVPSPVWIGHHPKHKQKLLATPPAMLAYVKKVETSLPKSDAAFLSDLKVKAIKAVTLTARKTARTTDKIKNK